MEGQRDRGRREGWKGVRGLRERGMDGGERNGGGTEG